MSIPTRENRDIADSLLQVLNSVARFIFWIGVLLTLAGVGFLVFTAMAADPANAAQANRNVDILSKVLLGGVLALGAGSTFLFWGEDILGAVQLMAAAAFFFSPLYLPSIGVDANKDSAQHAMEAIRNGGLVLGLIGIIVLIFDLASKAKLRMQVGSKADQLKYGKGIKEERDRQNVFMGKCWQLPFCRKFVREKCPIYHAKRTCWRELVGCMCEESVIRNAMENKPIPKDALLAANLIPHNHKLTVMQKRERCKTCVIYNEHQKHKYKLAMPLILLFFGLFYLLCRTPLLAGMRGIVQAVDKMIGVATMKQGQSVVETTGGQWFVEVLTICFVLVLFTYAMKLLEFLIFKLKV